MRGYAPCPCTLCPTAQTGFYSFPNWHVKTQERVKLLCFKSSELMSMTHIITKLWETNYKSSWLVEWLEHSGCDQGLTLKWQGELLGGDDRVIATIYRPTVLPLMKIVHWDEVHNHYSNHNCQQSDPRGQRIFVIKILEMKNKTFETMCGKWLQDSQFLRMWKKLPLQSRRRLWTHWHGNRGACSGRSLPAEVLQWWT